MTDREQLDAQWCAEQDAAAVGDPTSDAVPGVAADPRWDAEAAFYAALEQQGQGATEPSAADLDLIDSVLAAEAAPVAEAPTEASSSRRGGLVALVAMAAAIVLVWFAWPSDLTATGSGTWVAQSDGTKHGNGDELPQAVWLVAGSEACGTVDGATLCAEEGTVVRVVVQGADKPPRIDVERGTVTVREGTWTVVTPKGERTLARGESITVEPELVAKADPRPAIVPEPPGPPDKPEPTPTTEPEPTEPEPVPDVRKPERVPSADAATMLADARSLRGQGNRKKAGQTFAALIKAHPNSAEAGVARVSLGQLRLSAGRNKAALSLFSAYLRKGGSLAEEALWGKIQALNGLGRKDALAAAVAELERRFPRSVYRARAQGLAK